MSRFQGLDREGVRLVVGGADLPAVFEGGHSKEEKLAAVQYLRFSVPESAALALVDSTLAVRLVVDHPACSAERILGLDTRAQLAGDLADA